MADPYTQAAMIAAPFARLGSQMFQGQNMYEAGRMKSAESVARQNALDNHANLYGAQAQKAQAEADAAKQRATYQTPEFATKLAANLAGLSEGQGAEIAGFQQRGNWGTNPGYDLPPDQDGPTMPAMPKSAPSWYSPQVEQRVNQARGAALSGLAGTGNSDAKNVLEAFLMAAQRGDMDKAMQGGNNGLNAYQAAMKGGMYSSTPRGILNQDGGKEAVNEDWRKVQQSAAAENYAQAGNASASRDLTRSKIGQPTVNQDGSITAPVTSFGKAPAGYRFKQDGSLEPIPGGPVDLKINPPQRIQDASDVLSLLEMATPLVEKATGSYAGTAIDAVYRAFGQSNEGSEAAAQLKALEGALISKMPKMSGPQSDKDVLLYRQMAGQIGDPTIPSSQKKAAMETIRAINERNSGKPTSPLKPGSPLLSASDKTASVLAARKAIADGRDKAGVISKLEASGITDHGIK